MQVSITHNGATITAQVIVADRRPTGTTVALVSGDFPTTREARVDVSRTIAYCHACNLSAHHHLEAHWACAHIVAATTALRAETAAPA